MPVGHPDLLAARFDEVALHVHGHVADAGPYAGDQQDQRQRGHRTSQGHQGPAAQGNESGQQADSS